MQYEMQYNMQCKIVYNAICNVIHIHYAMQYANCNEIL